MVTIVIMRSVYDGCNGGRPIKLMVRIHQRSMATPPLVDVGPHATSSFLPWPMNRTNGWLLTFDFFYPHSPNMLWWLTQGEEGPKTETIRRDINGLPTSDFFSLCLLNMLWRLSVQGEEGLKTKNIRKKWFKLHSQSNRKTKVRKKISQTPKIPQRTRKNKKILTKFKIVVVL